jgi:hypothetical protein
LQTISLGWLWTVILLISASWVARITGVSHRCPARMYILYNFFCCCYFEMCKHQLKQSLIQCKWHTQNSYWKTK